MDVSSCILYVNASSSWSRVNGDKHNASVNRVTNLQQETTSPNRSPGILRGLAASFSRKEVGIGQLPCEAPVLSGSDNVWVRYIYACS